MHWPAAQHGVRRVRKDDAEGNGPSAPQGKWRAAPRTPNTPKSPEPAPEGAPTLGETIRFVLSPPPDPLAWRSYLLHPE